MWTSPPYSFLCLYVAICWPQISVKSFFYSSLNWEAFPYVSLHFRTPLRSNAWPKWVREAGGWSAVSNAGWVKTTHPVSIPRLINDEAEAGDLSPISFHLLFPFHVPSLFLAPFHSLPLSLFPALTQRGRNRLTLVLLMITFRRCHLRSCQYSPFCRHCKEIKASSLKDTPATQFSPQCLGVCAVSRVD